VAIANGFSQPGIFATGTDAAGHLLLSAGDRPADGNATVTQPQRDRAAASRQPDQVRTAPSRDRRAAILVCLCRLRMLL
jgi:hypothetical protein